MPPVDRATTYTFTMEPTPQEASKIDQDRTALSRTLSSLAMAFQSSVFGGLDSLVHDLTLNEKGILHTARHASRCSAPEVPPGHLQAQRKQPQPVISAAFFDHKTENQPQRSWYKKKYRIIVQEISDDEYSNNFSEPNIADTAAPGRLNTVPPESDTAIPIAQPKSGSSSLVLPPGLLDWLLFTTHEDSFFRHLGRAHALVSQANQGPPDIVAVNDTNKSPHAEDRSSMTPVTPLHAVPKPEGNTPSDIAMALATEMNHSITRIPLNEASVQSLETASVVDHRQYETTTDTTSIRSNRSKGERVQNTSVPRKVDFEDMDLQTPWWKRRQHREQGHTQPQISDQKDTSVKEEARDKIELQRADETPSHSSLCRRLQGESAGQPKALETFVKTTVGTRPDGAVESKTVKVSTLLKDEEQCPQDQPQDQGGHQGWFRRHYHDHQDHMGPQTMVETETRIKVVYPDGSVEETMSLTRADNPPPASARPSARTRREHRHHLRQQERERREQVWQAQQGRQQRLQREQQEQLQMERQEQLQREQLEQLQREQQRQQQEKERSSEPNVENDIYSQVTRSRVRERWARYRDDNQGQDWDQHEPPSSPVRSRSWPPKGYLRRQSQSEQAAEQSDNQRHEDESQRSTWPPKAYVRRQEREQ